MQGKQYVLGKARTINGIYFESADRALEALQDYGCLHFKTPIICGVSEPTYSPEELKRLNAENKKTIEIDGISKTGYEWKQTMRRLETEARKTKDQIEILKSNGDVAGVNQLNDRLRGIKSKYNLVARETGIKAQPEKMAVIKSARPKTNHYIKSDIVKPKTVDGSAPLTKQFVKELNEEILKFEKIMGETPGLNSIKFRRYNNDGVWGQFNDNSGELTLFGMGGKQGKANISAIAKKMYKEGKWSTSSPYHSLRHELAHSWLLSKKQTNGFIEKLTEIQNIKDDVLLKLTSEEKNDKIIMKNSLSIYGLQPLAEIDDLICECVAEYINGKPRKVARTVVEILMREV